MKKSIDGYGIKNRTLRETLVKALGARSKKIPAKSSPVIATTSAPYPRRAHALGKVKRASPQGVAGWRQAYHRPDHAKVAKDFTERYRELLKNRMVAE